MLKHPIPFNVAEAMLEPFYDRHFSGIRQWRVKPETKVVHMAASPEQKWWETTPSNIYVFGDGYKVKPDTKYGLAIEESWQGAVFSWAKRPDEGPALDMERNFDIDCSGWDNLVLSAQLPLDSQLVLYASTDKGMITKQFERESVTDKQEYVLPLQGARRLLAVQIQLFAGDERYTGGHLHWLVLQNSKLLEKHLKQFEIANKDWEPWLKGEDYQPQFKPLYGILADEKIISRLRENPSNKKGENSPSVPEPEQFISDHVNFWNDTRFSRVRDFGNHLLYKSNGRALAFAGLINKDAGMLRMAARYALSIAACDSWNDSFMCDCPGMVFEHKAFVQTLCCLEIATIIDLAGEMFTPAGLQYLLRRLGEEGIANINWIIWKWAEKPEDIFGMNQLAWFSYGRIAAYAVLEKNWGRVKAYTELAYQELCESINRVILPDGGFVEGPAYFTTLGMMAGQSLYWYARLKNLPFEEVMPQAIKRSADFAEVFLSLDENMDYIPVCDARAEHFGEDYYAALALLLPDSHWVTLFRRAWARCGGNSNSVTATIFEEHIPKVIPTLRPFIYMPEMGIASSVRMLNGQYLKIVLPGNKAGAGHTHSDKGSFIIQLAGETLAMDPGIGEYHDSVGISMGNVWWHNMLIPRVEGEAPKPLCPLPYEVKPLAKGDETEFHAVMNLEPGWEEYYETWHRTWSSSSPDTLAITDQYTLKRGEGVEFNWVTSLPISIQGEMVVIEGKKASASLSVPQGCTASITCLPDYRGVRHNRLIIYKEGKSGILKFNISFSVK